MSLSNSKILTRRYNVTGARKLSNYCWGSVALIIGLGFFSAGLYSYYTNFYTLSNSETDRLSVSKILFFPQGFSLCFYGLVGILLGMYVWFCIFLKIGSGFTDFNKKTGIVQIFRVGFPGKQRFIQYVYNLQAIQSIFVKIPSANIGVLKNAIYMRLKVSKNQILEIPLDLSSEKNSILAIEQEAADLSKFLGVSLKNF